MRRARTTGACSKKGRVFLASAGFVANSCCATFGSSTIAAARSHRRILRRVAMLTHEQESSLHDALHVAGIRHGDHQEITIAVGVLSIGDGSPHLPFCSAVIRPGKIIKEGGYFAHCKRIGGHIDITNRDAVGRQIGNRTGVVVMKAQGFTNGHVELTVDPKSIQFVPVHPYSEPLLRHSAGQELAQEALKLVQS